MFVGVLSSIMLRVRVKDEQSRLFDSWLVYMFNTVVLLDFTIKIIV